MKNMLYILLLSGLSLIVSCKQQSNFLTPDEQIRIVNEVKKTLQDYHDDIRKSGLLAEFKYFDNSKDFFWVPPGYSEAISYDSVTRVLNNAALSLKKIDNNWEKLQVIPHDKKYATYTGQLYSTTTDTAGTTVKLKLVETGLLVKRKDVWKLLNGQTAIISSN